MLNFIVNPHSASGKNAQAIGQISEYLDKAGIPYQIHRTKHALHATDLAYEIYHSQSPDDTLVIIGGDGSLNEAIQKLPFEEKPVIGYIPVGSGLDFAAGEVLPENVTDALIRIIRGKETRLIDIGKITHDNGSRYFAVSTGIGYDATVCYDLNQSKAKSFFNRFHLGKFGYFVLGLRDFLIYKKTRAHLEITGYCPTADPEKATDPEEITVKDVDTLAFISSHITPFEGGGYPFAPSAKPDDGKLTVCLCGVKRRRSFFTGFILSKYIVGYHLKKDGNEEFHCTKLKITVDTPLAVHTDGEVPGKTSALTVESVPGALRLIC